MSHSLSRSVEPLVRSLEEMNGYSVGSNGSVSSSRICSVGLSPVHSDPGTDRKVGGMDVRLNLSGPAELVTGQQTSEKSAGAVQSAVVRGLVARESYHSLLQARQGYTMLNIHHVPLRLPELIVRDSSRVQDGMSMGEREVVANAGPSVDSASNSSSSTVDDMVWESAPRGRLDGIDRMGNKRDLVTSDSTAKERLDIMERMKANNRDLNQQVLEMRKRLSELESTVQVKDQRQVEMDYEMLEMQDELQKLKMEKETHLRELKQKEELQKRMQEKCVKTEQEAKQKAIQERVIAHLRVELLAANSRNEEIGANYKTELCAVQLKLREAENRCGLLEAQLDLKERTTKARVDFNLVVARLKIYLAEDLAPTCNIKQIINTRQSTSTTSGSYGAAGAACNTPPLLMKSSLVEGEADDLKVEPVLGCDVEPKIPACLASCVRSVREHLELLL
ncbi:hypothetical protein CBR_g40930 [Chara braunii]|uniref:Uncharacterized protein n=1 Tax=Chara braunii TaxID=69332 RepID=A0A388LUV2_CHABU|nr:hypothetical protein CBR_g40930 [Chara braunii]|eukprot:GBG86029.1 hypothetical protein CBR_g40930 [Chara braunii]